jgi:hypothetical protein
MPVAPAPTGVMSTDRRNIQDALNSTAAGGRCELQANNASGVAAFYVTDRPLIVPDRVRLAGPRALAA